ncbi:MAG: hypothetical protein R6W96_06405 [Clostridia bacterium]
MSNIREEEQFILENLLALSAEIESLDTRILQMEEGILRLESDIHAKQLLIDKETLYYDSLKVNLAEVLRSQQRAGVASRIGILLKATSLRDLVRRINLLRDLSKNTTSLMNDIESKRLNLQNEQEALALLMMEMETEQQKVREAYEGKMAAMIALEVYLDSLEAEKEYYEAYLASIDVLWMNLKALFSETIKSFTEIIEKGDMPEDTIEVSISFLSARGRIQQDKFNAILSLRNDLPALYFGFFKDRVTLDFPEYQIVLEGMFKLVDTRTIRYDVTSGTFYGLPLNERALTDLFSEGDLVFSLESILGKNTIRRIDHYDGYIELLIGISLF